MKNKKIIITLFIPIIILVNISLFYIVTKISNNTNDFETNDQSKNDIYTDIITKLSQNNLISNNWTYVSNTYGWDMESMDRSDKYYFYIDNENYEKYKHYWLEDIDKTNYQKGYNQKLGEFGDYVFHAINIKDLSYSSDVDYNNIHMSKDKTYYLVQIYNNAIYYQYISDYKDENNYNGGSTFDLNNDSLSDEYIFYFENDQLIMEKII